MNGLYFEIDSIELNNELYGCNYGSYKVIGANGSIYGRNCKRDIPVGTVFKRVHKVTTDGVEETIELYLKLVSVEFYRKSVEVVPGGHSARMELKGKGLSIITELVQSIEEGEHVRLEA